MKVSLNIENDAELRAYIKDLIRGQVTNLIREQLLEIVQEELSSKVKGYNSQKLDNLVEKSVERIVHKDLAQKGFYKWNQYGIMIYVNKKLDEVLGNKDWDKIVNQIAIEKIKNLIK